MWDGDIDAHIMQQTFFTFLMSRLKTECEYYTEIYWVLGTGWTQSEKSIGKTRAENFNFPSGGDRSTFEDFSVLFFANISQEFFFFCQPNNKKAEVINDDLSINHFEMNIALHFYCTVLSVFVFQCMKDIREGTKCRGEKKGKRTRQALHTLVPLKRQTRRERSQKI